MGNNVYANGREIACKASDGKSICAFPDVCFSPPTPPPTGVPIPYPNTGMASDTSDGSKTVKLHGKEAMLRNKSYFKRSTGDEAATPALKKGVLTGKIQGKVYFTSWSMDVKFEGENVVRHLDMTTHNHGSTPGNTPPWPFAASMAMSADLSECANVNKEVKDKCDPMDEKSKCPDSSKLDAAKKKVVKIRKELGKECADYKSALSSQRNAYHDYAKKISNDECHRALKCVLGPYKPSRCCAPQTPHHLVDVSSFTQPPREAKVRIPGCAGYDDQKAPCVCAEGPDNSTGTHGLLHLQQREYVEKWKANNPGKPWTLKDAQDSGAKSMSKVYPNSACDEACTKAQLKSEHEKMGIKEDQELRPRPSGARDQSEFQKEWGKYNKKLHDDLTTQTKGSGANI